MPEGFSPTGLKVNISLFYYVRRPVNAHDDFYAYWADGNGREPSDCTLYFADKYGEKVFSLPRKMESETYHYIFSNRFYYLNSKSYCIRTLFVRFERTVVKLLIMHTQIPHEIISVAEVAWTSGFLPRILANSATDAIPFFMWAISTVTEIYLHLLNDCAKI